jgi:3'-phosphoadenosine 5'-phosphosulfate sulfotransferase (PAPS reductase)/FAD synthetase
MDDPKHVVGLSGGKDSTALALWLVENEPREYEFICNETGDELPDMVAHWANLEVLLGAPLKRVTHTTDLYGVIEEQGMLPNFRSRFCTRILKIEPTIRYMESLPDGSVLYVGLRADEEMRRGIYGEDVTTRFPLREQGFDEARVWAYLAEKGVTIPARTDCAVCYHQRIEEWHSLYFQHPDRFAKGVAIEEKHGHTFRSPGRDTWPVALKELGEEFASGRQPLKRTSRTMTCRPCSL